MPSLWRATTLLALVLAAAACTLSGEDASREVTIRGALYVELHIDSPCAVAHAPREISGVTLIFRDQDGAVLGEGATGAIDYRLLQFGVGKRGWTHPGCRYFAPYSATVARAASYEVSFSAPPPGGAGNGSWFTGVEDLRPQTISHEELEVAGFFWHFDIEPSYEVGH